MGFLVGIITVNNPRVSTFVDVKICVKSKFKFSMKVSSAHYLLFLTGIIFLKCCF